MEKNKNNLALTPPESLRVGEAPLGFRLKFGHQRMASLFFPGCYPSTPCNLHSRQKINLTTSSSASRRKPLLLSLRRKETGGEIRAIYFILKSNIKSRLRTFPSFNGICQEINCFRKEARPADTVGRGWLTSWHQIKS